MLRGPAQRHRPASSPRTVWWQPSPARRHPRPSGPRPTLRQRAAGRAQTCQGCGRSQRGARAEDSLFGAEPAGLPASIECRSGPGPWPMPRPHDRGYRFSRSMSKRGPPGTDFRVMLIGSLCSDGEFEKAIDGGMLSFAFLRTGALRFFGGALIQLSLHTSQQRPNVSVTAAEHATGSNATTRPTATNSCRATSCLLTSTNNSSVDIVPAKPLSDRHIATHHLDHVVQQQAERQLKQRPLRRAAISRLR